MPGPAPAALTVPGRLRRSVEGEAAMGGALCWTIRHLSLHPGPPSFVVWLCQTSGFAGRFLNGPWEEVTPFPCRRR